MALLDFLKRKKTVEKAKGKTAKKPEKKSAKVLPTLEKQPEKTPEQIQKQPASKTKRTAGFSYDIIKEPHISERATYLAEQNQYTFKVSRNSNKTEIKKSIEGIYGVDVLSVNIIKIPAKKRRLGKTQGFKKGLTKAVVKIKEDQKIEIL